MNIVVELIRKGWATTSHGDVTVHVRGQAHLGNEYLDTQALAERFLAGALQTSDHSNLKSSNLPALISSLNGNWAMVAHTSSAAFLAVDHIRSIQLLYSQEGEDFYVFDDVTDFRKDHKLEIDEDSVQEYLSSGYVYRNRSLFKDVYSLQAAEYVIVSPVQTSKPLTFQTTSTRYWRYVPNVNKPVETGTELVKRVNGVFLAAMGRLVESIGDRRIVVPLSGGCDSRLIVNYLKKIGTSKVLCYTYGAKENRESRCSRMVAERLGYEWHFVEYSEEGRTKLVNDPAHNDCFRYMTNGVNRYCNQEFLALKALLNNNIITPERDVIVPGYYFDFLAGSHVTPWIRDWNAASEMCEWENNFFSRRHFFKSIRAVQRVFDDHRDIPHRLYYEGWAWQERLSKFIVNNVRSFEFLGLDWRLPLCDRELFDLWLSVPYRLRFRRKYFYSIFPRLVVSEIADCPIYGKERLSCWRKIKRAIGLRIPYVVKHNLKWLWLRKGRGSFLGNVCLEMKPLRDIIIRNCSASSIRLRKELNPTSNALLTLKGLALEMRRNQDG